MKAKYVFIPIILLVAAAAAAVYSVSSNPRYAFYLVGQAIRSHDIELFNKYVDIDSVVEEWVEWSSQKAQQELTQATQAHNNAASENFINLLMPTMRVKLKEEFTNTIIASIENTKKDSGLSGLPIMNLALLPIHSLSIEKRIATAVILHPATEEKIIFKMRRMPQHYWRITSIQVPSLMETTVNVAKPPPQLPDQAPNAISEEPKIQTVEAAVSAPAADKKNVMQEMVLASLERDAVLSKTMSYTEYFLKVKEKILLKMNESAQKDAQGEVQLKLTLLADGKVKQMNILEEKAYADTSLKEAVLRSAKAAGPYPVFPKELNYAELELIIPISLGSKE